MALKLLGISGSLRAGSYNTKLLHEAARLFGPCDFTLADLDFRLLNTDLDSPPEVMTLFDQIKEADAVIISGPEYNKSLSGVLKNALDWISVSGDNPWKDKPLAIMSAAAGRAGGERTQFALRHALFAFEPDLIYKPEVLIGQCKSAFDDDGHLKDEAAVGFLEKQMKLLREKVEAA